jgi:membrane protein required for colicin V production
MTNLHISSPLGWVDGLLLAVLALSVVVGLWRGLVFEVLSLLGWVAAYIAAQVFGSDVAAHLPIGSPGSALNLGAAFAVTFIGALIVWSLASRLVRLLVHATPLSLIDRVLGAGFGLLRGGVLLLALATVVSLTPAARSPAWQSSQGAAWLQAMLQELKPVLPFEVARHLPV